MTTVAAQGRIVWAGSTVAKAGARICETVVASPPMARMEIKDGKYMHNIDRLDAQAIEQFQGITMEVKVTS